MLFVYFFMIFLIVSAMFRLNKFEIAPLLQGAISI